MSNNFALKVDSISLVTYLLCAKTEVINNFLGNKLKQKLIML